MCNVSHLLSCLVRLANEKSYQLAILDLVQDPSEDDERVDEFP